MTSYINIRNPLFNSVDTSETFYHTNSVICINSRPTSTETKCSLPSSLKNVKSIKSMFIDHLNVLGEAQMKLYIDKQFKVPANNLPSIKDKIVHLEAVGDFLLMDGHPFEKNLISEKIPNNHLVEAIIPPSSCSNLTLKESITEIRLQFTGDAKVLDEHGQRTEYVTGHIIANVLDTSQSEVMPCV